MSISFRSDDYMYSSASVPPPKLDTHAHKYYELLYFLNGDASYIVGNRIYRAEPGDIFVTAPDEEHRISFSSNAPYERQFIQIAPKLMSEVPDNLTQTIRNRICGCCNRLPAEIVKKYRLNKYFTAVHDALAVRSEKNIFLVRTYIMQLIVAVGTIPPSEITELPNESRLVNDIESYIDRNVTHPISLDKIAAEFFLSKYYLCHIFRAETGMTIKNYISIRRIILARELLAEGRSAADVPKLCGFNDYSTFYRTFKRYTGHSPTAQTEK